MPFALAAVPAGEIGALDVGRFSAYVNPIVAELLGWLILEEQIPPMMLVASAVFVVAVATIVRNETGGRRTVPGQLGVTTRGVPAHNDARRGRAA